jgi:hypothetical protein
MSQLNKYYFSLLMIIFICASTLVAQNSHDIRSLGMGNTSTATSTGVFAASSNPANLMIFERYERWNVVLGHGAYMYNKGFTEDAASNPTRFIGSFYPSNSQVDYPTTIDKTNLISEWFGDNTISINTSNLDVLSFGISYTGINFGIALTHRIRGTSENKIGRGWYDNTFLSNNGELLLNRQLQQNYYLRHEMGAAIAWEYDLVSGWLSDLSRIYIGFNPKLILPIMYFEHDYNSVYVQDSGDENSYMHQSSYTAKSAGLATDIIQDQINAINTGITPQQLFSTSDLMGIAGYGVAFDAGITYIIGLDRDVSLTSKNKIPTYYSLRLAASVNDIGFLSYNKKQLRYAAPSTETVTNTIPSNEGQPEYTGSPYQFFPFIESAGETGFVDKTESSNGSPIRQLLPSRANVGAMLQLNRLVVSAEIQHPLDSQSIDEENTSFHLGTELRVFKFLPLRAGIIFESDQPTYYTAGFGLDFKKFVISAATMARTRSSINEFVPVTSAAGTIQIRF